MSGRVGPETSSKWMGATVWALVVLRAWVEETPGLLWPSGHWSGELLRLTRTHGQGSFS